MEKPKESLRDAKRGGMEMSRYLPYTVIPALLVLLFVLSGGFFGAAARWLLVRIPHHDEAVTAGVLSRALLILLAADLLAAGAQYSSELGDTVSRGYLVRGESGEGPHTEELEMLLGGERREVRLEVAERILSPEETEAALDRAEEEIPKLVFGAEAVQRAAESGGEVYEISHDLDFPAAVPGEPVELVWMQDSTLYMDFSGHIADEVPEEGAEMGLSVNLRCGAESRELTYRIRVLPAVLDAREALEKQVREAVGSLNSASDGEVRLPEELDGRSVSWSAKEDRTGIGLLFLGALIAVFYLYSRVRLRVLRAERREDLLRKDYPAIVSKLVLLMTAGLSMRHAFSRIASDYERRKREERPGCEEIVRIVREMERGVPEAEAYRRLGQRAGIAEYRTFATVIIQNLRKGGAELVRILEREAQEAQENRKKLARIRGEEAGTKLLLPMLLMLAIVMALLMVPAFVQFF